MATINISLPDEMRAFVEKEAKKEGYSTVSEYLRGLIRQEKAKRAKLAKSLGKEQRKKIFSLLEKLEPQSAMKRDESSNRDHDKILYG